MGWRLKPSDALIFDFFLQTRFQRWLGCASTSSLLGSVCLQLVTGWAHTLSRGKVFFTGNVTSWLALLCQRLHFLFYSRVFGVARATGWSKWKKVIKQPADRLYLLLLRIMATERVFLFFFVFCVHIIWPKCQKMCTKKHWYVRTSRSHHFYDMKARLLWGSWFPIFNMKMKWWGFGSHACSQFSRQNQNHVWILV